MAKRKRAKNQAEYEAQMAQYNRHVDSLMENKQRYVSTRSEPDVQRAMYNPKTIATMSAARERIKPSIADWYRNNPQRATPPRDEQAQEDDPEGNDAIRNNVLDAINGQLLTPEQRDDQAAMSADPELARQILAEKAASLEEQKPALLTFLENLSSGYMWANHQVTHPFTAALMATNPEAEAFGDVGKAWEQSDAVGFFEGDRTPVNPHNNKKAISFGQAAGANPFLADSPLPTPGEILLNHGQEAKTGDPNSDEMRDYFENNPLGKLATGTTDFAQQSLGDGLALAAKGLRLGVGATRLGAATSKADKAAHVGKLSNLLEASRVSGEKNALGDLSNWLVEQSGSKGEGAIRARLKKMGAGDRADVAHLFARTDNREKMDLLLRASWNDKEAIKELRSVDTSAYVEYLRRNDELGNKFAQKAAWDPSEPGKTLTEQGFDKALKEDPNLAPDYIRSVAERNPSLAADLNMALSPELNVVGALGQANLTNKIRPIAAMQNKSAAKLAESDFGFAKGARLSRYNESKWAVPINVLRWPAREKPSGVVGTKGISKEGSTAEIEAFLNSPKVLRDSRFAELKNNLMSHWGANSHLDARASGAVQHVEAKVMQAMAEEYGKKALAARGYVSGDAKYGERLQSFVNDKMTAFQEVQRMRDREHMTFVERGYAINQSGINGPELIKSPELSAHLRESVPMLDMNLFERSLKQSAKDPSFKWTADEATKTSLGGKAVKLNNSFQSVWRPAVLLRAAYPIRNTTEGYARVLGFVGLHSVWQDSLETAGNMAVNTGRRIARKAGSVNRANKNVNAKSTLLDERMGILADQRAAVQAQTDEILRVGGDGFDYDNLINDLRAGALDAGDEASKVAQLNGKLSFDLNTHLDDVTHLAVGEADVASLESKVAASQGKFDRAGTNRHIGSGELSKALPDGSVATVPDAFSGKLGEVALGKVANDDSWAYMSGAVATRREGEMRKRLQVVDGMVTADDLDNYKQAVFDASNKIFRDNVVTQMRLDPTKTSDDFLAWFYSKEGRFEQEAQHQFGRNVTDQAAMKTWFDAGRENLLKTFPDDKFRQKIAAGTVTQSDVERYVATVGPDNLPPVIGDVTFDLHGATKEGGNWWTRFTQKAFHVMGAVPENTLVRQPYYKVRFTQYMDANLPKLDSELAANADVMAKVTNEAHRYALRRLRRDIYTIQRQKNLPSMIENVSPFWTAQVNTATTWPRIFAEKPESIAGIARTYTRMREAGMIDDEGYFNPIPGWTPTVGGMDLKIPVTNVLSMFAGNPSDAVENMPGGPVVGFFAPSAGPQLQVIVSEMQKGTPGFKQLADLLPEDARKKLFELGNPMGMSTEFGSFDMLLPSWGRQALAGIQGEGNGTYDAMAAKVTQIELAKFDQGLRTTYPTKDEIGTLTNQVFLGLLVGAFTAPGAPRAVSPVSTMVDISRGYQAKYGYLEGTTKFLEVYGEEWAAALTHGTKNQLGFGMQQNQDTLKLIRDNPALVEKIAQTGDTEMVSLLMGSNPIGEYDESGSARRIMLQTQIPGSDSKMLEAQTPEQIMDAFQTERGWREFRQQYSAWRDAKVDTWVKKYGSTADIPSEKWKALKARRESVIASIGLTNETWASKYNATNDKGRKALGALRAIRSDKKFWPKASSDPYWQTVSTFIDLHDETSSALKGGKPKNPAQSPDEFFAWNDKNNAKKGYNFAPSQQAKFRAKVMKEFNTAGSERNKQWQLAKYKAGVEELRRKNVTFNDMFDRWFGSEDYDDNAF